MTDKQAVGNLLSVEREDSERRIDRMSISEQVKELREVAEMYKGLDGGKILSEAADTIEALSAELQAANMEQITENKQDDYKHCEDCGNFAPLPNGVRGGKRGHCKMRHRIDARSGRLRACKLFVEKKGQTVEDCGGGWIPCKERLPQKDETVLIDTGIGYFEIATYSGDGKTFYTEECGSSNAVAWQPLPEPYHEP